jgi:hypothetical protein
LETNGMSKVKERVGECPALEVLERRDRAFRVLCDTILQVERATEQETFSILCSNLRKISGAACAVLASYEPVSGTLSLKAVDMEQGDGCTSAEDCLGVTMNVPAGVLDTLGTERVRECEEGDGGLRALLPDSAIGVFSEVMGATCYLLSCVRANNRLVVGMVWLYPGQKLDIETIGVVDVYLNVASVILQRMYAVVALREVAERGYAVAQITGIAVGALGEICH